MVTLPHIEFRMPFHPERSKQEVLAAAEQLLAAERAAAERCQEQRRVFCASLANQREKVRQALGAENYDSFQRLQHDLRLESISPQFVTRRHGMYREELARRQKDQIQHLLKERGVSAEALVDLRKQLGFAEPLLNLVDASGHLEFADYLPAPVTTDSPVTLVNPPFSGWQIGLDHGAVSGFQTNRTALLDANTGHVGNIITLDDWDASDFDTGSVIADTQIAFWYQAPATGLVRGTIVADCGEARHQLQVIDEWGVSDSSTTQQCLLMMHVLHPNVRGPSFSVVSDFNWNTDNSSTLNEQFILPGTRLWVTLFSDGPVNAGDWIVIRAGCRNQDGSITNDMEIHNRSAFSWFIKEVRLQIQ
jgi:hypothetical protein